MHTVFDCVMTSAGAHCESQPESESCRLRDRNRAWQTSKDVGERGGGLQAIYFVYSVYLIRNKKVFYICMFEVVQMSLRLEMGPSARSILKSSL